MPTEVVLHVIRLFLSGKNGFLCPLDAGYVAACEPLEQTGNKVDRRDDGGHVLLQRGKGIAAEKASERICRRHGSMVRGSN